MLLQCALCSWLNLLYVLVHIYVLLRFVTSSDWCHITLTFAGGDVIFCILGYVTTLHLLVGYVIIILYFCFTVIEGADVTLCSLCRCSETGQHAPWLRLFRLGPVCRPFSQKQLTLFRSVALPAFALLNFSHAASLVFSLLAQLARAFMYCQIVSMLLVYLLQAK